MKGKILMVVSGVAALMAATSIKAADTKIIEVYLQNASVEFTVNGGPGVSDFEYDHSPFVIGLSRQINNHFALDFRLGLGDEDTFRHDVAGDVGHKFDRMLGIYGRVGWTIAGYIEPYALIGLTDVEHTITGGVRSLTSRDQGTSYGVGLKAHLGESVTLHVESMQMINDSDMEVSATSVGVGYRF